MVIKVKIYISVFLTEIFSYKADSSISSKNVDLLSCTEIGEVCLMPGECSYSLDLLSRKRNVDWIKCEVCEAWYHCVCIGIGSRTTKNDAFKFSCCARPSKNDMLVCYNWESSSSIIIMLFTE